MNQRITRLAIIHPDTLAAIGLRQIIQDVFPMVDTETFNTVDELIATGCEDDFFHYFVATNIITDNISFFSARKRKTIILSPSQDIQSPFSGFHHICTSVPEKQLVRSLLALEQGAHAHGRNLPPINAVRQENKLSAREIEVMSLIVKGLINKEIADRLNIGLSTVVTHRRNIMEKLSLKSVSALTIYAVTHGYVDINDI